MPTPPARPPVLLYTCLFLGVASTLVLLELVEVLSSWDSVAVQDAVRDLLAEEPFSSTDITLSEAMSGLRVLAYVGVVVATAGAVFSVFTARGDRTSRVMLTVLSAVCALLLVTGGVVGLLLAAVVLWFVARLWSPEVRRWFDAVDGRGRPDVAAGQVAPGGAAAGGSPATEPSAEARGPGSAQDSTPSSAAGVLAPVGAAPTPATGRPRPVRRALVASAVAHAVLAVAGLFTLLGATVGAETYREELSREGVLRDLMSAYDVSIDTVLLMAAVTAAGCLVVAVLGLLGTAFALRPRRGAKLVLQLGLGLAGLASFVTLPFGIVSLVLVVVGLVQLEKPEARTWFAA